MARRRIGYHRIVAKPIRSSLEEPDQEASIVNVCKQIIEHELVWRYNTLTSSQEVTVFLYDFSQVGDFYVGRFVRLRHDDLVTFESNGGSFSELNLEDGSSLSEIMHFVFSPTLRVLAVDAGRSVPGVIQLMRYLNLMQSKDGYIADLVRLEAHVIGHPDIISELRKHHSVKTLTVTYDNGNAIDTNDPIDVARGAGSIGNVGRLTQVFSGLKRRNGRGRGREDVITTNELINKIEAEEFPVGAFGNISAEVATEFGEITLRLFGDKIKEYVNTPNGYYRDPNVVYEQIIASINRSQDILRANNEDI